MTLDEAIKHAEEIAEKCEFDTDWGIGNHFIDRSGVADIIKCAEEHRQLAEWLKELKQLKEQTCWIPVSERLPEEREFVLTQAMFKDDMKMCVSSRIDWNYWTGWGTRNINIIAWMPLPEPYKAESEDE